MACWSLATFLLCFVAIRVMIDEAGQAFHKHMIPHDKSDDYPVAGLDLSFRPFGSPSDSTLFTVEQDKWRR